MTNRKIARLLDIPIPRLLLRQNTTNTLGGSRLPQNRLRQPQVPQVDWAANNQQFPVESSEALQRPKGYWRAKLRERRKNASQQAQESPEAIPASNPQQMQRPPGYWKAKLKDRREARERQEQGKELANMFTPEQMQNAPEIGQALKSRMYDYSRINEQGLEGFNQENKKLSELQSAIGWSRGDEDVISQIKAQYPETRFQKGEDGTIYAELNGEVVALNKSGLSSIDSQRFVRDATVIGAPSAVTAGTGGLLAGLLGRIAGGATGAMTGSLVGDEIAEQHDGAPMPKLDRALLAGVFGGSAEIAGALISKFGPGIFARFKEMIGRGEFVRNGVPTEETINILRQAEIPDEAITPKLIEKFSQVARQSDDLKASARMADAQSLPQPVQLTTGQASQNPAILTAETAAKKGAITDEFGQRTRALADEQQTVLDQNAHIIRENFTGNSQEMTSKGFGAIKAQAELFNARQQASKEVGKLFTYARNSETGISVEAVINFRKDVATKLNKSFDLESLPVTTGLITQLTAPASAKGINLIHLENWRQRVSRAYRSAQKGTQTTSAMEAAALGKVLGSYDEAISNSLTEAIVAGSADDIAKWRRAISARKQFANRFETTPIINRLTRTTMEGGERTLVVDAADAATEILGRGILGMKKGLHRDLNVLKRELSPQSWNGIRDEAILKLFSTADGNFHGGSQFAKRFEVSMRDAPMVMRTLFDKQEIQLLAQLSRTAKLIERRPMIAGDMNPSGTGTMNALINRARVVGGPTAQYTTAWLSGLTQKTQKAKSIAEVSEYFAGVIAKRTAPRPRAFLATGQQIGREYATTD